MSESVPRILVIRRRYLGDLVLLGPVLHSLRTHWPHAHITVLTEASYAGVLAINPDVDETSHFPHSIGDCGRFGENYAQRNSLTFSISTIAKKLR